MNSCENTITTLINEVKDFIYKLQFEENALKTAIQEHQQRKNNKEKKSLSLLACSDNQQNNRLEHPAGFDVATKQDTNIVQINEIRQKAENIGSQDTLQGNMLAIKDKNNQQSHNEDNNEDKMK